MGGEREAALAELKDVKEKLMDVDLEKWGALAEIGDVQRELTEAEAEVRSLRAEASAAATAAIKAKQEETQVITVSEEFEVTTKEAKSVLYDMPAEQVEEVYERPLSYMEMLSQQAQEEEEEMTRPLSYLESLAPQQPAVAMSGS